MPVRAKRLWWLGVPEIDMVPKCRERITGRRYHSSEAQRGMKRCSAGRIHPIVGFLNSSPHPRHASGQGGGFKVSCLAYGFAAQRLHQLDQSLFIAGLDQMPILVKLVAAQRDQDFGASQ